MDAAVTEFGDWLAGEYRSDARYDAVRLEAAPDAGGAELVVRLVAGPRSWYEARVDLTRREVQVGFATEVRTLNEALEQMVLDNGGDLSELLGDELSDLDEEPLPMEHFFERPAFRYTARVRFQDAGELADEGLRRRVQAILTASRTLFQECIDEA